MMKRFVAALAVLSLTPMEPLVAGPLAWIDQAYQRLNREFGFATPSSYILWNTQNLRRGLLQPNSFVADSARQIRLTAACDTDCNRLTIRIKDYRGAVLGEQTGSYGAASLYYFVSAGQTYRVEIHPEDCSTEYCYIIYTVT